jgi:hypothetical protein
MPLFVAAGIALLMQGRTSVLDKLAIFSMYSPGVVIVSYFVIRPFATNATTRWIAIVLWTSFLSVTINLLLPELAR